MNDFIENDFIPIVLHSAIDRDIDRTSYDRLISRAEVSTKAQASLEILLF